MHEELGLIMWKKINKDIHMICSSYIERNLNWSDDIEPSALFHLYLDMKYKEHYVYFARKWSSGVSPYFIISLLIRLKKFQLQISLR